MSRIAPNTLAHGAIRGLREIGFDDDAAIVMVNNWLDILEDPDAEMLDAGMAELELALPPGHTKAYRRDLTRCVWRAMLARVPR